MHLGGRNQFLRLVRKMKVSVSESTLFRIFVVSWVFTVIVCTLLSVFPFGMVFGMIFGVPVGLLASFLYVQIMSMAFGEDNGDSGSGDDDDGFNFGSLLNIFRSEDRED